MRVSKFFVLTVASLVVVVALAGLSAAQTFTTLYSFAGGNDGANPYCFLIFDKLGNLYGTTDSGGVFAFRTIFELSPNGAGGWAESVLHSFNWTQGGTPLARLAFATTANIPTTPPPSFSLIPKSPRWLS